VTPTEETNDPEGLPQVANLADLLGVAARTSPDQTALVEAETGRRLTWAQLDAEVDSVARGLSGMGLVAGYRVVISQVNRVELVASYLGALRARLVAVPVNPWAKTGELARMIADAGARAVVADQSTVSTVRAAVGGLEDALAAADEELRSRAVVPRIVVAGAPAVPGETSYDAMRSEDRAFAPAAADPDALAVLLYTSGTSGRPRAAMLTHRALLANIEQVAAVEPPMVKENDVVFGVLPLFHVYGLNAVLGQVLRRRASLVLVDEFDPEGSLDIIEDEAVTVVPVAPPVFAYWRSVTDLRHRLGHVRLVLSGSAPLAADLVAQFTEATGLDVHQGYGLTEAAPVVTSTLGSPTLVPGSVGAALPGVEIRLVDEAGHRPAPDDPGEIQIRGANLFSGYWPDRSDGPGEDGWWSTGDVGLFDEQGNLTLVDRVKELVIVSGFNVYPSEVEDVIVEVDGVAEAAVIGIDDDETGEAVVAYVKPSPGATRSPDALVEAVRAWCADRLARFKQPSVVHVVDELPHTVTGKVAKGELRATQRRRTAGLLE
jgi:long-chain acyl-CoA synthetase